MCSARTQSSFPEQALYYYIKSKHSDAISRFTDTSLGRYELDIFVPSLAMGIEYDGKHWHSNESSQQKEVKKFEACKTLGITLVRVRESYEKTEGIADHLIYVTNDINATIKKLISFGLVASDINVERDRYDIMSCYLGTLNERSFASKHPILANEWCYDKNGDLTPDMFSEFSTQAKFWWKCSKGHIWQSTIAHRTSMNSNCPYCSNRKLLIGYNDLNTLFPNIAIEWHPIKNGELRPTMVMSGSKKKAWWKCSLCGHEWFTSIQMRTRGTNCPECAKQKRKKKGT
jgi:DNA-directed RNA polymerase subunit RPC12/RpoP/very-short-patch-repair endonuclease